MNLLQLLRRYGQSVWLNGYERSWVLSGRLQQYIEEDGLRGVQLNFAGLKLAIQEQEYDCKPTAVMAIFRLISHLTNCLRLKQRSQKLKKSGNRLGGGNLILRIPATQLLLPVIEQLISDHINVNATLVFSPNVYEQIFDGYLRGRERLVQQGESASDVVCFVSVSMGRLDTAIALLTVLADIVPLLLAKEF